mgnify:CR=1 FL=1
MCCTDLLEDASRHATDQMEHPDRAAHFVPACAVEMDMDFAHGTVYARIYNENAADQELENPMAQTSCEPAQSKCTWTYNESHFM